LKKSHETVRLVPIAEQPYDEFESLIDENGWTQSEQFGDDRLEWVVPDRDTVVRWVEDEGVQFFVVEGMEAQDVAHGIETKIPMLYPERFEEYLQQFSSLQGMIHGIWTIAAASPKHFDKHVRDLFLKYFRADDPLIRRTAVIAACIPGWSEFQGPVEALTHDPDPSVREDAEAALRTLHGDMGDRRRN
jgi:hypothetical protein